MRKYEYKGESKSLREWGITVGIEYATLYARLTKHGNIDKALETPKKRYTREGVCQLGGRWKAYISREGKQTYLGVFDTEAEARAARAKAEEENKLV